MLCAGPLTKVTMTLRVALNLAELGVARSGWCGRLVTVKLMVKRSRAAAVVGVWLGAARRGMGREKGQE